MLLTASYDRGQGLSHVRQALLQYLVRLMSVGRPEELLLQYFAGRCGSKRRCCWQTLAEQRDLP